MSDVATVSPREHDEAEAKLFEAYERADRDLTAHRATMHYLAGDRKDYRGHRPVWRMTLAQVIDQLKAAVAAGDKRDLSHGTTPSQALAEEADLQTEVARIMTAINEAEAIYKAHGWTRFFPCLNRDGHIHSSLRGCPSVHWDTQMGWTPELSGKTVETAVAELGEALCTICFPLAPVEWKSKTLGQVKDDRTRSERDAAKAAREAVKAVKNLTDGQQFRDHRNDRVTTVAACKQVLRAEVELRDYYGKGAHPWWTESVKAAEQAVRVLLEREAANPGTGATQAEIDKIIDSAIKRNRKDGARI
jgi:hypothetical protein